MVETTYLYDGSFEGMLTAVAMAVKAPEAVHAVCPASGFAPSLFNAMVMIESDQAQANRLFHYLQGLPGQAARLAINGFLSEDRSVGSHLLQFVRLSLAFSREATDLYSNDAVRALHNLSHRVSFEAHRLNGLLRFRILADGLQYAPFSADHNVIGYCADHFRHRLANRQWILHDLGRNLALYWNTEALQTVEVDADIAGHVARFGELPQEQLTEEEHYYQQLWRTFHTSIANPDRENKVLQAKFIPRRYWRYLVEKQSSITPPPRTA